MRHWIKMRDYWTFKPLEVQKDKKHLFECKDAASDTGKSLLVRVAATHAGIVNGNMRFYRPDRMQSDVHTWVPKNTYPRPVLIGHNDDGQVLGRVLDAKYVDESYKYKSEHTQIRDCAFYDSKKKLDLFKSIDWIVENLIPREDYTGLGYIDLGMKVTNPEAIQKVLRDEYLTVSVGFRSDAAICSICHTDWAVDDKCEHKLGEVVDGKKMFLIAGHMDYEEVSFVNFPADPFATTISKEKLADSLGRSFLLGLTVREQSRSLAGLAMTDSLYGSDIQIVEDRMPETNIDSQAAADLATLEVKDVTKEEKAAVLAEADAADKKADCGCGGHDKDDCSCAPTLDQIDEADRAFFNDSDALYTELEKEIDAAVAAGELTTDAVKDAKLSSEARKKLSGGTFCGPNRSFPVPDCAHVTAARRLIGRASVGESTKSKILACVSRKASSLGCGGKKDSQEVKLSDEMQKLVDENPVGTSANEVVHHYDGIHKSYKAGDNELRSKIRGLHYAVGEHMDSSSALEYYKERLKEHGKDCVVLSKEEHDAKAAELVKLTADVTALSGIKEAKDAAETKLARVLLDHKKGLATQIVMSKVMRGQDGFKDLNKDQIFEKVAELSKRSLASLKDSVNDIMSELKWTDAVITPAAREDQSKETKTTVNDNAQIVDPAPGTKVTDQADQAKDQQALELHYARLMAMSPTERMIYQADLDYTRTTAKKS
jgi:hypothetical protein